MAVNALFREFAALLRQIWETDRATLTANAIAQTAVPPRGISFGMNDLTQSGGGCRRVADDRRRVARATHRRDDSGSFIPACTEAVRRSL
jgi:citrate lyase beta subunit